MALRRWHGAQRVVWLIRRISRLIVLRFYHAKNAYAGIARRRHIKRRFAHKTPAMVGW